jgi:hypothetical protein
MTCPRAPARTCAEIVRGDQAYADNWRRKEVDASPNQSLLHAATGDGRLVATARDVRAPLPVGDGVGMQLGCARQIRSCPAEQGARGADLAARYEHGLRFATAGKSFLTPRLTN